MKRTAPALVVASLLFSLMAPRSGAQTPARTENRTLVVPGIGAVTYGMSVPGGAAGAAEPRPLILALHPGGGRTPLYGAMFMRQVVAPAFADLGAIIVAPDCPGRSWTDPNAETAVLALLAHLRQEFAVDRRRVLVTGFSMGGRGAWFMSSRHAGTVTAAVVVAGSAGDEAVERLASIPTYVIHSRDDQVVPFGPAEETARQLQALGRTIQFEALSGPGHFEMGRYVDPMKRAGKWIAEQWKD
jgi:predicted peptidase